MLNEQGCVYAIAVLVFLDPRTEHIFKITIVRAVSIRVILVLFMF